MTFLRGKIEWVMSWQSSETRHHYVSHIESDMSRLAQSPHMRILRCYLYPECCVCHWDPSQSLGWELMQKWLNSVNHSTAEVAAPRMASEQVFWEELFLLFHCTQPTGFCHAGKGSDWLGMQLAALHFHLLLMVKERAASSQKLIYFCHYTSTFIHHNMTMLGGEGLRQFKQTAATSKWQ